MTRALLIASLAGALLAGCPTSQCPPGFRRVGDLCQPDGDVSVGDAGQTSITIVPTPDFVLLHAGESRSISLAVAATGVSAPYDLAVTGLPAGVTATMATHSMPAAPATLRITFSASASASPFHADVMLAPIAAAASLASPISISVQVAGPSGSNVMAGAGRVVLWSATAADESRYVASVWADSEGPWATVVRNFGTPAMSEDHLLRLSSAGAIVHELTAHPTAVELGQPARFVGLSGSAVLGPRPDGGVFLGGVLTDATAFDSIAWIAALDADAVRHGQAYVAALPADRSVSVGAAPFREMLIAGSSALGYHRYLADLTTDTSFGVDGTVSLTGQLDGVDDTGGLLVRTATGVVRYHADGRSALDTGFAVDGTLELVDPDPTQTTTFVDPFAVGAGAFVVSATSEPTGGTGTTSTSLLWRVRNDGSIDVGFGGGLVRYSASMRSDAHAFQVLSDDTMLVLVIERDAAGTITDARIERLTPAGVPQSSFGPTGTGVHLTTANLPMAYADERSGRLYVLDGGTELSFQVYWL